jgi:hypothetical protein
MRWILLAWLSCWTFYAMADQPAKTESPWQLLFRQHAADYTFTFDDERKVQVTREPILFWSQPVRGGDDGGVFLWTSSGRPVAIGTFFVWPTDDGRQGLTHELHSLTLLAFEADWKGRMWHSPAEAVEFKPLMEDEPPADTAEKRLLQLKKLARRFTATSQGRDEREWELRLLPRPLYRYELPKDGKSEVVDGLLLGLVQGTDLEIVLVLEATRGKTPWRWAAARMSDLPLTLSLDGKLVWQVQKARFDDARAAYFAGTVEYFKEPSSERQK